mmetsp:Transcript_19117/g.27348  ORF Transcript_19117/g.27348 Transcript_19117/m.27348 type:complete len:175 (-) Transcript_19117:177-701(-)
MSSKTGQHQEKHIYTFNPVVSVFCWILGSLHAQKTSDSNLKQVSNHDLSKQDKVVEKIPKEKKSKSNSLTWKDEISGGNVNEYINAVQQESVPPSPLSPNSPRKSDNEFSGTQLARKSLYSESSDGEYNGSPSPNWGFYVAITPPQQDSYHERTGHDLNSINEDYRRKNAATSV